MAKKIERKTHQIDAAGQILGRLATRIAIILRGKHKPTFMPNLDAGDFVMVSNVDKIKLTGNKLNQKVYRHATGYLGGLKSIKAIDLMKKNPAEILRKAVTRMLPKNKLQKIIIKRLKFK